MHSPEVAEKKKIEVISYLKMVPVLFNAGLILERSLLFIKYNTAINA